MPLYDYRCPSCGVEQVEKLSLSELDTISIMCHCGSEMERFFKNNSIAFMSPEALGRKKAPEDFRNFLSAIKKAHDKPGNPSGIKDH